MSKLPLEYGDLAGKLLQTAGEKCLPINGTFELTRRCNLDCRMCYISCSASDPTEAMRELSVADWVDIARQAKGEGMLFLLLTGGEVFLRPDFFDIYEPLTTMGFLISLYTNATLISPRIAKQLAEAPPQKIEITLYGATATTYESITGVPGSFSRSLEGIEALLEKGLRLSLKTTITRQNIHELDTIEDMANQWGIPFSASWLLAGRRDGLSSDIEACRVGYEECVELEAADPLITEEWRCSDSQMDINFYCEAGKTSFVIDPFGRMNVCMNLSAPGTQVLKKGFRKAWEDIVTFVRDAPGLSSECRECDAVKFCPVCPAWSALEHKKLSGKVDYLCKIAHERKRRYE